MVVIVKATAPPFVAAKDADNGFFFAFIVNRPGLAQVSINRF